MNVEVRVFQCSFHGRLTVKFCAGAKLPSHPTSPPKKKIVLTMSVELRCLLSGGRWYYEGEKILELGVSEGEYFSEGLRCPNLLALGRVKEPVPVIRVPKRRLRSFLE